MKHVRGSYKGLRTSTPQSSGAPKPSNALTPSSILQDSVNRNPSISPNETNMLPGLNMTTTTLSKPADARPLPLLDPRRELSRKLWTEAIEKFPDIDLGKSPRKPSKILGLHSLVEHTCDIIHLDLLHCKDKSKDAILTLYANGLLGRKVFNAWGAISMDPEIKVKLNNVFLRYWTRTCVVQGCFLLSGLTYGCCDLKNNLPMLIYEAAKQCVKAFCLKDKDLMKGEIAAFIQYQTDMHVYN